MCHIRSLLGTVRTRQHNSEYWQGRDHISFGSRVIKKKRRDAREAVVVEAARVLNKVRLSSSVSSGFSVKVIAS